MSVRMPMNTLAAARRSLAQLTREYKTADPKDRDHNVYRNLCYGFSILLQFFKAESDEDLLNRLDDIESQLTRIEHGNQRSVTPNNSAI